MRALALIFVLTLTGDVLACAKDSDCKSGQECAEGTDGKFRCYDIKPAPPKKDGYKKRVRICDATQCGGSYVCAASPFPIWCPRCCWVTE